jgi:DNA-binding CsgD family transcriptional regulator
VAWPDLDPRIRELAEEVLTERQLAAFKLASDGAGYTTVAVSLDISRSYARDLVRESQRRLERADAPAGYLSALSGPIARGVPA